MPNLRSPNLAPALPDKALRQFLQFMRTDLGSLNNEITRTVLRKVTVTSGQEVRLAVSDETVEGVIPILNSVSFDTYTAVLNQDGSVVAKMTFAGSTQEVTFLLILRG